MQVGQSPSACEPVGHPAEVVHPPEVARRHLAAERAAGAPFNVAWPVALSAALDAVDAVDADDATNWRAALDWARPWFERAYPSITRTSWRACFAPSPKRSARRGRGSTRSATRAHGSGSGGIRAETFETDSAV